ncbi:MAG: hypothetical protein P8016_15160, partial [Sedimentisphaerales bacterium]
MADADDAKQEKPMVKRLLPWMIMVVVVGLCAGAGLGLGTIIAGTSGNKAADANDTAKETSEKVDLGGESGKFWYYDLEPPVVANLNEPGVTRYVSASLTLQMNAANEKETRAFLNEKTPILRNWLYI